MIYPSEFVILPEVYVLISVYLLIVHHFICGTVSNSAWVVPQPSKRAHFDAMPAVENLVQA